jgi:peptide/nickel transport system substrate-binding protein
VEAENTRQNMISAGPFSLGSYNAGSSVEYVRNDSYHGEPTYVDSVEMVFLSDDSAIQAAIRTGELQLGVRPNMPNTIALDLKEDLPDAQFTTFSDNVIGGIFFDLSIWTDPRARQALNVALDRNGLLAVTDSLGKGGGWGSQLPALPPFAIDSEPADSPLHDFFALDLQRARQLLDAAGIEDGFDGGNFAIPAANTYGPTFTEAGLLVQANLAAAGINLSAELRDSTQHYATTFRGTGNDAGFGMTTSVQGIEADELFVNMYRGDSPRSPIINGELMFEDQTLTDLIDGQLAAPTIEERTQVIADLQLHLAEQMYMLPYVYPARNLYAAPELILKGAPKFSFTGTETMATAAFRAV